MNSFDKKKPINLWVQGNGTAYYKYINIYPSIEIFRRAVARFPLLEISISISHHCFLHTNFAIRGVQIVLASGGGAGGRGGSGRRGGIYPFLGSPGEAKTTFVIIFLGFTPP